MKRKLTFLSYAHDDLDLVRKVYNGLKLRKVDVWFDKEDLGPGRWKKEIKKKISKSKYFIFCISEASLKKSADENPGFVEEELQTAWEFAQEQDEKVFSILPVRLEDCDRGDMRISSWQQYDLFPDFEMGLDELAVHLEGISFSDTTAKDERTETEKIVRGILGRAHISAISGNYEKALGIAEAAILIAPDHAITWIIKGAFLDKLYRYKEALKATNKAIEIEPDNHIAWDNKGRGLNSLGQFKEALKAFKRAIEIRPESAESWGWKGAILGNLNQHNEALEAISKAIKIKPDYALPWHVKGQLLYQLGRYEEALEAFNKTKEILPDNYEYWYQKYFVLCKLGRDEDAQKLYKDIIDAIPDDPSGEDFPYVMQDMEAASGAACLKMILKYYVKDYDLDNLIKFTKAASKNRTSMLDLSETAESLKFITSGVRIDFEQLKEEVLLPCIVHWRMNHFVVVYKITEDFVFVADPHPINGRIQYTKKQFCALWIQEEGENKNKGLALLLKPTEE